MEPESSLLCSQELTTGLYPEVHESNLYQVHTSHPIFKSHINIV